MHKESRKIEGFIRQQVFSEFKKRGVVVGLSGGVDSSVTATLCVRALGPDKVLGVILPEKESHPSSSRCARIVAKRLGIKVIKRDITSILKAFGAYAIREEIVKKRIPHFRSNDLYRMIMPGNILESKSLNIPSLEVKTRRHPVQSILLQAKDYLTMIAATNIKQRTRMILLYYYAEQDNYIVAGTTNLTEYLLGFFVKYGDGGVDIDPIRHLYKTEVYQLAKYLKIPKMIIERKPSPDTFSYPVSDEELYFRLPYQTLDLLLYAWKNNIPLSKVKKSLGMTSEQLNRVFRDFQLKCKIAEFLKKNPPDLTPL